MWHKTPPCTKTGGVQTGETRPDPATHPNVQVAEQRMAKFFFDISGAAWHLKRVPQFSGIQRAVTLMIDRAARRIDPAEAYLSYYDKTTARYRAMPLAAFAPGAS